MTFLVYKPFFKSKIEAEIAEDKPELRCVALS